MSRTEPLSGQTNLTSYPWATVPMARLMLAFFVSGFAALLCQIIWQRMLGVFAGSDTVSASLVVGAFLAGLGIGSIVGASIADRLSARSALIGFALAETAVAVFALASKFFLYDFLATDLAGVVDEPSAIFALCFAGLLLPTTLMGASLPLLSRAVATSVQTTAQRIGRLYSLNTLGAGLGALLGGWILVGELGFLGALMLAAALDLIAAGIVLTLLKTASTQRPARLAKTVNKGADPFGRLWLWCLLVFISGFVIVALEIVWVRFIGQVGMFHAYLFPTVLSVFLLADGLGMALASRLVERCRDPRPGFFLAQAGGFAAGAAMLLAAWWVLPFEPLAELLSVDKHRMGIDSLSTMFLLTIVVVGPSAFLIGMTFPFVQRAVQHDLSEVGARVGWVQLANIAGNAAGAIGTGLFALHWLGTAGTLKALAVLSVLLVLGWLASSHWRRWPEMAVGAACAVVLIALPNNAEFWSRLHQQREAQQLAWSEDRSGVALFRGETRADGVMGGPFFIQGFSQGRVPFLSIHQLLGAVGPLVHPNPQEALVIGVGSGGTPWAAAVLPQTHVRAVELVQPVLSVHAAIARAYPDGPIGRMLSDPRWRLEYADGRRLLAKDHRHYDIIEADAILPEASLSGMLYSREFLDLARARLAPGGIYVQWTPTCRSAETFRSAFAHSILIMPARIMLGSDTPIGVSADAIKARFSDPAVHNHLLHGNPDFTDYASLIQQVVAFTPLPLSESQDLVLTDLHPRDEFFLNHDPKGLNSVTTDIGSAAATICSS
jgi:spermidine synthase